MKDVINFVKVYNIKKPLLVDEKVQESLESNTKGVVVAEIFLIADSNIEYVEKQVTVYWPKKSEWKVWKPCKN